MPYSKAEFDTSKQFLYKTAVAITAGTSASNVDILSITEKRRRVGSVDVETKVSTHERMYSKGLLCKSNLIAL